MPHAFVQTRLLPQSALQRLGRISFRFENIIVKTQPGYTKIDSQSAILPCLVIEPFRKQRFYVQLRSRENAVVIKLDPASRVVKTAGVRLALVCIATRFKELDPESSISKGNLGPYFQFFEAEGESAKRIILEQLRKDLRPYLRSAMMREATSHFTINLDAMRPPLKWAEIFLNDNPIEIEVGPGKGRFMLDYARSHPEINFLLIEWSVRYLNILAHKIPRKNIRNLRLLAGDARMILAEWIVPGSVSKFHIYFPDPWWKRRHEKHRLFSPEFLNRLENGLCHHGRLVFATDVETLYDEVLYLTAAVDGLKELERKTYEPGSNAPPGRSNFEIKKWAGGSPIYEAVWEKRST